MIPFEEKLTAWLEGKLSGKELEAFEKELSARPIDTAGLESPGEKEEAERLGSFLRQHSTAPRLTNPDFFNHQISQRIAVGEPRLKKIAERTPFFWPLRRLVLSGGFSLVMAFALYKAVIPATSEADAKPEYTVQVVEAWPSEPTISATTVHDSEQDMTVVWLDGLESVSGAYAQQ